MPKRGSGPNRSSEVEGEVPTVTQFLWKIRHTPLSAKELAKLGLRPDWHKKVPDAFVKQVADRALQYTKVLRELSKH